MGYKENYIINPFLFFEATKSKIFDYAEKDDVIEIFLSPYNGSLNKSLWQIDCKNKVKRSYQKIKCKRF